MECFSISTSYLNLKKLINRGRATGGRAHLGHSGDPILSILHNPGAKVDRILLAYRNRFLSTLQAILGALDNGYIYCSDTAGGSWNALLGGDMRRWNGLASSSDGTVRK